MLCPPTLQPDAYAALPIIMQAPPHIAPTLPNGASTALTNSTPDTSVAKEAFDNFGETLCEGSTASLAIISKCYLPAGDKKVHSDKKMDWEHHAEYHLGKTMNKARKDAWIEKVGKPLAAKAVSKINNYVEVIFVNRLNESGMTYQGSQLSTFSDVIQALMNNREL